MAPADKKKSNPVGRPTEYKKAFCKLAKNYALLGAIDDEISDFFDVSVTTLENWKNKYPEFLAAINEWKAGHQNRLVPLVLVG